jgi:hypothetical protein
VSWLRLALAYKPLKHELHYVLYPTIWLNDGLKIFSENTFFANFTLSCAYTLFTGKKYLYVENLADVLPHCGHRFHVLFVETWVRFWAEKNLDLLESFDILDFPHNLGKRSFLSTLD